MDKQHQPDDAARTTAPGNEWSDAVVSEPTTIDPGSASVTALVYDAQWRKRRRMKIIVVSAALYTIVLLVVLSHNLGPERVNRDAVDNLNRASEQLR